MIKIAYVTNAPALSGLGRPAREIFTRLPTNDPKTVIDEYFIDGSMGQLSKNSELVNTVAVLPGPFKAKPLQWWRLARKLPQQGYNLWHFTNQSLSFIPRSPAIVTAHDLVELLDPQGLFARSVAQYLYRGIPNADHVICLSNYTKKTVQDIYSLPDNKLSVIPNAVSDYFRPVPHARQSTAYQKFLTEHKLTPDHRLLLYVGSEHPRKNLGTLVAAFAQVRQSNPQAVLIKVGSPGLAKGRIAFLAALDRHHVRDHTRILNSCSDAQLRQLYSLADVFVMPSTYEGFGIPPLEAMACGCPVVTSNATSLPEVVGNAGILCDPHDTAAFTRAILNILTKPQLSDELRRQGIERAAQFTWADVSERTLNIYHQVLERAAVKTQ